MTLNDRNVPVASLADASVNQLSTAEQEEILEEIAEAEDVLETDVGYPGSGILTMTRTALKALGRDTIVVSAAGNFPAFVASGTKTGMTIPMQHTLYECAASTATGVTRALKQQGNDDTTVLSIAGDNGSMDIGFQALSGAADRNEDMVHICYDNEAAVKTGVQMSSSTPTGAVTSDEPGGHELGKKYGPAILEQHDVPYVATAAVSHLEDLYRKVQKAKEVDGFAYVHVIVPSPSAWKYDSRFTIDMARQMVECGLWPLYEVHEGEMTLTYVPDERIPVSEYIEDQDRFASLTDADVEAIQRRLDEQWGGLE